MANRTKLLDRSVGYVEWDSSELTTTDVLRIQESLGRPGAHVRIETDATSNRVIKINSRKKVYPPLSSDPYQNNPGGLDGLHADLSNDVEITTNADSITIPVSTTWTRDLNVRDIEVTFSAGTF